MNMRAFVLGFLITGLVASFAYAATVSQIWNDVFDPVNNALKVISAV